MGAIEMLTERAVFLRKSLQRSCRAFVARCGGAEESIAEGVVENLEVVESEAGTIGRDIGGDGVAHLIAVSAQAKAVESEGELVDGDLSIVVTVEEVKDTSQTIHQLLGTEIPCIMCLNWPKSTRPSRS